MLQLYIKLVSLGIRTIESIPEDYRERVRAAVEPTEPKNN